MMIENTDIRLTKRIKPGKRAKRRVILDGGRGYTPLPTMYYVTAPQNRWEDMHLEEVPEKRPKVEDGLYLNLYPDGRRRYSLYGQHGWLDITHYVEHIPLELHWEFLVDSFYENPPHFDDSNVVIPEIDWDHITLEDL